MDSYFVATGCLLRNNLHFVQYRQGGTFEERVKSIYPNLPKAEAPLRVGKYTLKNRFQAFG
jgi:hypothetical protein